MVFKMKQKTNLVCEGFYSTFYIMYNYYMWSFMKRQMSGQSSEIEWQRMPIRSNEWYNEWKGMTTSENQ